ncbi:unnamed protein product [Enterobius vermicularis]|uniref:Uncharacterized protein n=1 Tax=Enterobius vermicularis TaxID=51028 RepID=A0A0N4V9D6_ENTVE|nr:unnamed protein product [Enterobius vermicularis]
MGRAVVAIQLRVFRRLDGRKKEVNGIRSITGASISRHGERGREDDTSLEPLNSTEIYCCFEEIKNRQYPGAVNPNYA